MWRLAGTGVNITRYHIPMSWMNLLQWPAMLASVAAAWLVGSRRPARRQAGFWVFLTGNVLWAAWAWHDRAWALLMLQVALASMNLRGVRKTGEEAG